MTKTHTPEPWQKVCVGRFAGSTHYQAVGADSRAALSLSFDTAQSIEGHANLNRVLSCVNACAGLNPEAVPEAVKVIREIAKWLEDEKCPRCQHTCSMFVDKTGVTCLWYDLKTVLAHLKEEK